MDGFPKEGELPKKHLKRFWLSSNHSFNFSIELIGCEEQRQRHEDIDIDTDTERG